MKKLLFVVAVLFIGYSASAQITDDSYKPKVKKLIDIQSGSESMMDGMVENLKKFGVSISDSKMPAFKKEVQAEIDKFKDQQADAYMKVYSKDEIDAMLKFYTSPMGKKIQAKQGKITAETAQLQQDFQQKIMPIVQKYM